jgi:hypothetical protein
VNNRKALFVQAIRGPVLLITLGILFAIHQAGGLPIYRTWPLLIIVVGVMKLMERTAAPASGAYAPPPPPGGPVR